MSAKLGSPHRPQTRVMLTACVQRIPTRPSRTELATIAHLPSARPALQVICVLLASRALLCLATLAYSAARLAPTVSAKAFAQIAQRDTAFLLILLV